MARLPPIRRLSTEDFKEQAGWIEKLLAPLNDYMERTTSALNRGLTIGENFAGEVKVVEVDGTWPVRVTITNRPAAVLVGNVLRSDGTSFTMADAVQVQWSYTQNGQLSIDGVTGVTPSATAKYKLTLVSLAG